MATSKGVVNQISKLRSEMTRLKTRVNVLSRYLVDPDRILTQDDIKAIGQAERDLKSGRTKRLI